MSTRAIVAVGTLENWRGVYNHSDGYPTWLGKELYEHLIRERLTGKTLTEIGEDILHFDDWDNYRAGGVCPYCGKIRGRAHTISLAIASGKGEGYPDPEAKRHKHNGLRQLRKHQYESSKIAPKDTDIEWVYVIDAALDTIHVLSLRPSPETWAAGKVGEINFKEAPDLQALECGKNLERCRHYAWAHFPELKDDPRYGRLGTSKYLGQREMDADDAYAVEIDGVEYQITGSGYSGGYRAPGASLLPKFRTKRYREIVPGIWYSSIKNAKGESFDAPLMRTVEGFKREAIAYKGVKLIYPPTRSENKVSAS